MLNCYELRRRRNFGDCAFRIVLSHADAGVAIDVEADIDAAADADAGTNTNPAVERRLVAVGL